MVIERLAAVLICLFLSKLRIKMVLHQSQLIAT